MLIEVLELPFLEKVLEDDGIEGRSLNVDTEGNKGFKLFSAAADCLSDPLRFSIVFPKPLPKENPKPERDPLFTGLGF